MSANYSALPRRGSSLARLKVLAPAGLQGALPPSVTVGDRCRWAVFLYFFDNQLKFSILSRFDRSRGSMVLPEKKVI